MDTYGPNRNTWLRSSIAAVNLSAWARKVLAFGLDESRLSILLKGLDSHRKGLCLLQVPKSDCSGVRRVQYEVDVM